MPRHCLRFLPVVCLAASNTAGLASGIAAAGAAPPAVGLLRHNALHRSVWPADFNGDGIVDLAAQQAWVNHPPFAVVALGKGDGTFGPARTVDFVQLLNTGDFDNDGRIDLVAVEWGEPDVAVYVLPGKGDGTFGPPGPVASFVYFSRFAVPADLDGDGNLDLIVGQYAEGGGGLPDHDLVTVVPGNGDRSFRFEEATRLPVGAGPQDAAVGDFNGDGRKDIAVAARDGRTVSVYLNRGGFAFAGSDIAFDGEVNDVAAADVNRDGRQDLIVASSRDADDRFSHVSGHAEVLLGTGDGAFHAPVPYTTAPGAWRIVAGDFTGDGLLDLATANRSAAHVGSACGGPVATWDSVSILPGTGDGAFQSASSFAMQNQADLDDGRFRNSVLSLHAADVNRDGRADLIPSWGAILFTQAANPNWPPAVDLSRSAVEGATIHLRARATDVDHDLLAYRWSSSRGDAIPDVPEFCVPASPGTHTFTVTVDDGHGHQVSRAATFTIAGVPASQPLAVTAPAGSEVVAGARPYTIRWTTDGSDDQATLGVFVSADGGATWTELPECRHVRIGARRCTWNSPGPNTERAVVALRRQPEDPAPAESAPFKVRYAPIPFGAEPLVVPGRIQAEDYDRGGDPIAFHDATPGNSTGLYRHDDVDIQTTVDAGGGYKVKTAVAGEWLVYTVEVQQAGTYAVDARVSSGGPGGTFHLEVDGTDASGPMRVPDTGGWESWRTVSSRAFALAPGRHTLRLVLDSNGAAGLTGNFNWFEVRPARSTPYRGGPASLPGRIEAEHYDAGGEGLAYHDTTAGNATGLFRDDDVDLQTAADAGGGYKVKSAVAGEWLSYSVEVTAAGTYAVDVRVTSRGAGGTFHIAVDGADRTGPIAVPDTGGWESWRTVTRSGVALPAGRHTLTLVFDTNGPAGLTGNFNWIVVR